MKPNTLYCITHEQMELVEYGEITGLPAHHVIDPFKSGLHPYFINAYWCEGPFASCPPPEVEDWDVVFADEEGIQDLLDYMRQEEMGV